MDKMLETAMFVGLGAVAIAATSARPDLVTGVTLPIAVGLNATEEGSYAVEFEFGDQVSTFPIHVDAARSRSHLLGALAAPLR